MNKHGISFTPQHKVFSKCKYCTHTDKSLINYDLDMDACMPDWIPVAAERAPIEICVAYQCNNCGAFLDASVEATDDALQRCDLPEVDYAAWNAEIDARINRAEPERTVTPAMTFLAGAVRR